MASALVDPLTLANLALASAFLFLAAIFLREVIRHRKDAYNTASIALFLLFVLIGISNLTSFVIAQNLSQETLHRLVEDIDRSVGGPWVAISSSLSSLAIIPAVILLLLIRRYDLVVGGPHALVETRDRLQIRNRQMEAVQAIITDITRLRGPQEIADSTTERLRDVLGAFATAVYVRKPDPERLVLMASAGMDPALVDSIQERGRDQSKAMWEALELNKPVYHPDIAKVSPDAAKLGVASVVFSPLRAEDQVVGVLVASSKKPNYFSLDALELVESVGNAVGIALRKAQLYMDALASQASLQARNRQVEMIQSIVLDMTRSLERRELGARVAETIRRAMGADAAIIFMRRSDQDHPVLVAVSGVDPGVLEGLEEIRPKEHPNLWPTYLEGRAMAGTDFLERSPLAARLGMPSVIFAPLRAEGESVGALALAFRQPRTFSREDVEFVESVGYAVGVGLRRADLYHLAVEMRDQLQDRNLHMETVQKISSEITKLQEPEALANTIARRLCSALGAYSTVIYIKKPNEDRLRLLAIGGITREDVKSVEEVGPKEATLLWRAFTSDRATLYSDAYAESPHTRRFGTPSLIFSPLRVEGKNIGVLVVSSQEPGKFTPEDANLVESIGNAAGVALANAQLYKEAGEARARAEASRRETQFLLDMISHDLRNYSVAAYGMIQLATEDQNLMPETRDYLHKAMGSMEEGNRVIEASRRLSRITHRGTADLQPLDLQESLQRCFQLTRKIQLEKDIAFQWQPNGQHPTVMGDEFLDDLLVNLLTNAVKYTPGDRVEVDVDVAAMTEGGQAFWCLSVGDHGVGVPDNRKEEIFDRFTRGAKGFGLGLSIVKAIADRYRGRVWVEDRVPGVPGKGSVFKVLLPRAT